MLFSGMVQTLFGPNGFIHADEDENGNVTIMWAGKPYYSCSRSAHFAKNLGISLLASLRVRHKDIQRLFGVSGKTIKRILALIKKNGLRALSDYRPGAPEVDQKIRDVVIEPYKELEGTRGYQTKILDAVQERYKKGEFSRTISRQSLYTITKDYRGERERIRQENEQGEGQETEGRCSNREMAFAYVALNAAKVVRVEQDFKTLPSYLMGGILGRGKLPSLSLYRSRIPMVVQQMDMGEVIRETSRRMSGVFPFSRVLYVDGHIGQQQQALQRLCEELNERGTIDIGLSIHKLVFSVN